MTRMDQPHNWLEQLGLGGLAGMARAFSDALRDKATRGDIYRYFARGVVGVITGYICGLLALELGMPQTAAIAIGGWLGADGVDYFWKRKKDENP